jgi:hypothetical protein
MIPLPRTALMVLLLCALAFGLSLMVSRVVFERLPHLEDEVAYLFQAKVFARGQVTAPLYEPARAYWQPFVIEHEGVRFGKYPPGWPALLALGVGLGLAAWVNAALSAVNVALVYRIGRDIYGPDAGLIAAVLLTFSPMALLLNATLMSHTAALTCALVFMWAYRRMSWAGGWRWGAAAGLALGLLTINRPLSAVAVAVPFIAFSGVRVLRALTPRVTVSPPVQSVIGPLLVLSGCAMLVALAIPAYQAAAAGDPWANLYTMVPGWEYDRVGFGPDIGRNGHTLAKGIQFARYDLTVTAADLFGWQIEPWSDLLTRWAVGIAPAGTVADSYWPAIGLSLLLIPVGVVLALRETWGYVWGLAGMLWAINAAAYNYTHPEAWALVGVVWLLMGLGGVARRMQMPAVWAWLLLAVLFCTVAAHMAYWIGSQRYSTRYYYEAVGAAVLLSALPLAMLARRGPRWRALTYVLLAAACLYSYTQYSVPRISALRGFNRVTGEVLAGIEQRREAARPPVLVIVSGQDARWRTRGALMAISSPFLDADIEVAYHEGGDPAVRAQILSRAEGRQIIEMAGELHDVWFVDACDAAGSCPPANLIDNPTLLGVGGG